MGENYADTGDHHIQVGQVLRRSKQDRDRHQPPPAEPGTTTNIRTGNATVGEQVDDITGPFIIR
ncbi:hypothetical protein AB0B94_30995 [Micromonospora sp. NPDC048986]|uniref:hypothetical protein n=1 Tax=Micromonospora sp. NPDC048986 TaxID=3155644 RepID=UPI0033E8DD07